LSARRRFRRADRNADGRLRLVSRDVVADCFEIEPLRAPRRCDDRDLRLRQDRRCRPDAACPTNAFGLVLYPGTSSPGR
jgi:hypothetical protein